MAYDNPVRRLHSLLIKAFEAGNGQPTAASKLIWAKVFEVSVDDNESLISCTDELFGLLRSSLDAVKGLHSVNSNPHMRTLIRIRSLLYSKNFLNDQWKIFSSGLKDQSLMDLLEMTANAIDRETRLTKLSQDQLNDLLTSAKELLEDIRQSDLDDDIKNFLFIRLDEVCSAIQYYSISGSTGLRRVIEANIGGTLLKLSGLTPEERKTSVLTKFLHLMVRGAGLLGLMADAEGFLLPKVAELLQLPPRP
ncbi:hypothetical protein N836_00230 [Leptolyngbya sp. Heron Island J]|uniref:hypothetical protein n=1 Tax=Leptolyngbya sp. Heron Island J TaxID=1385935 RepID=UPI0003B9A277|nr:hypothetical protein [Leptolyngbya sp. Heron Island J]ESA37140.1 hypothetical protein N836_00230 [Leptolyngbya sp. Heron Island J]